MVKISSRKDLLGYSSSITKCRWSLGWSWGIPSVKLTGWAGHSYSLLFFWRVWFGSICMSVLYIYMLYVHRHAQYVLESQNIHILGGVCKIGLVDIKHLFLWSYHGKRFFVDGFRLVCWPVVVGLPASWGMIGGSFDDPSKIHWEVTK